MMSTPRVTTVLITATPTSSFAALDTTNNFAALEGSEKAAAVSVFVFSVLSTIVLSLVLLCILSVAFAAIFKRTSSENLSREAFFFRSQLGQYASCLLLSNWIRSVSGWINIKWINDGGVRTGTSCLVQGSLKLIGQFGSFFFIVAMGVHTFNTLVLRNRPPHWLGVAVTSAGWTSSLVIGLAPLSISSSTSGSLYNINDFTCGISKSYQVAYMLLYFLPLFLASLLSALVYSLIFLMLRGTLVINGGLKIQLGPESRLRARDRTFQGYQRFVHSVAQKMLWLPISFILVLLPSSIVQLMDISNLNVSSGAMAFSYILEDLDGVINVLILFNVLRALGPAIQSTTPADSEKVYAERGPISRPKYDWKPQARSSAFIPGPVKKTAPPAHPPESIHQGNVPGSSLLPKSLFPAHKKSSSANSTTHLLMTEPPSRINSPSPSLERKRSEFSSSSGLAQGLNAPVSVMNIDLAVPQAVQNHTQTTRPQISLSTLNLPPLSESNSTALAPSPRAKRSRVSRDLNLISESPTTPTTSLSDTPFLEVTLQSPRTSVTGDGVGSFISMYLSRNSNPFVDLPPFPAAAVQHDSSVDLPVIVPDEENQHLLKATVSIGAVGGRHLHRADTHPKLPPLPLASPAHSTDQSQYSDSEVDSPPLPPLLSHARPVLQPTLPLRVDSLKATSASRDRQPAEQTLAQRNRPLRALPKPPDWSTPSRSSSMRSQSQITSHTSVWRTGSYL